MTRCINLLPDAPVPLSNLTCLLDLSLNTGCCLKLAACDPFQGQAAAGQALEEAMAATREAAQRVDATVSILRQVQV